MITKNEFVEENSCQSVQKTHRIFWQSNGQGDESRSQGCEMGVSHVSVSPDDVILDVGCGGGKTVNRLAKLAPKGKVYGVDYSEDSVKIAIKQNKKLIDSGNVEIFHVSV